MKLYYIPPKNDSDITYYNKEHTASNLCFTAGVVEPGGNKRSGIQQEKKKRLNGV